uniref:Uncharacterized protein n=1 Tax=Anguilla anguilla TaxID=7936 RepID=A0A0E9V6S9_ANGAN
MGIRWHLCQVCKSGSIPVSPAVSSSWRAGKWICCDLQRFKGEGTASLLFAFLLTSVPTEGLL